MNILNEFIYLIHRNGSFFTSLNDSLEQEVTTKHIGEMVMEGLKDIDGVAYVRFASVYRQFTDISAFVKELEKLKK